MNAQLAELPRTDLAVLPPAERAQAVLRSDDLAPKLKALAAQSAHIVTITNPAGRDQCHAKRMVLKNERINLEKRGKGAREDATAFSKAIIAEETRLIDIIKSEEDRLGTLQGAWDAKIETEKEAERQRIQEAAEALRGRLDGIRTAAVVCIGMSAIDIAGELHKLETLDLSDLPPDQVRIFEAARAVSSAQLGDMYADKLGAEQEAQRLDDERCELQSLTKIVIGCAGKNSTWITNTLTDLRADHPVNPTDLVTETYASTITQLERMIEAAAQIEAAAATAAREAQERERVDGLKRDIANIRLIAQQAVGQSSEAIAALIAEVEDTPYTFEEFSDEAHSAVADTLAILASLHASAIERERMDAEFRTQAKAESDRKAQEAADKRAAETEKERAAAELARDETQKLIAECTLFGAATVALAELSALTPDSMAVQMLRSAIERAA